MLHTFDRSSDPATASRPVAKSLPVASSQPRDRTTLADKPVCGNEKLVSMLIAVQDEEAYLAECLDSLLAQTHSNLEVIIVDDHSSDNSREIVEQYSQRDPRVRLLRSGGRGKVAAFNLAWEHSMGEVIMLFAGDDVLPPRSVEMRARLLEETGCEVGSGKVLSFSSNPKYDNILYPRGDRPNYSGGALVMTRAFAGRVFPIPPELPNEDQWVRLHIDSFARKFSYIGDIVSHYRIHESNSMAFGAPFHVKSAALEKRSRVYTIFLERYRSELRPEAVRNLETMVRMCDLRAQRRVLGLLLLPGLGWRQKLSQVSVATPFWYRIRLILERHLMGR